ncbi:helix-turn-helix domain-containing protein [Cellulosimicrobium protaetiae]|uniref:Helix-turn-helix domain-containing protein n=1 Tax=Cellulosimicrobium protaetiae TaxID=2587808 RepID=A0A6M5UFW6_9MICO|nr:helix-turn-helix domain-containing protein [Cellulosimicrobium protaetiae]QJW35499.1 helix-turn-helix domain-containing protein [Cellulosimicrobium protaetiae]
MTDLRAERERAGLTQARLAEITGIAASNLSAYESGKRQASPAMLDRIRRAMIRPSDRLRAHRDEVRDLIRRNGGHNPRVFGSVARGDDTPMSDVDIVVDVRPEDAWRFVSTSRELSELLGVHVDVVTEGGLRAKHRDVLAEAVPL